MSKDEQTNWIKKAIGAINVLKDIPDGLFEFPPFLKVGDDRSQWIMLAYSRRQPPANPEQKVCAPFRLIEGSYPDLDRINDRRVSPKDFDLHVTEDPSVFIGDLRDIVRLAGDESLALNKQYRELLCTVLEHDWLIGGDSDQNQQVKTATEIRRILHRITPKSLQFYYRWLSKDLDTWINRVLKSTK